MLKFQTLFCISDIAHKLIFQGTVKLVSTESVPIYTHQLCRYLFFKWTQNHKIRFVRLKQSQYVLLCGSSLESLLLRALGIRTRLIRRFPWLVVIKEKEPEVGSFQNSVYPSLEQWGPTKDAGQDNHLFIYSFSQQIFIESLQCGARCQGGMKKRDKIDLLLMFSGS